MVAALRVLRVAWNFLTHKVVLLALVAALAILAGRGLWHRGEPVERGKAEPAYDAPESALTKEAPRQRVHTTIKVPKLSPKQLATAQEKFGPGIRAPELIKDEGSIFDGNGMVAVGQSVRRDGQLLLKSTEVEKCRWGCDAAILLNPDDSFGLKVAPKGRPKHEWFPAIEAGGFIDALDPQRAAAHIRLEVRRDASWHMSVQPYVYRRSDGQVDRGVWIGEVWRKERD